jgi:hypothetical protein
MFPINWLKQRGTRSAQGRQAAKMFRRHCPASKKHVRFKPELEVLEGRVVPAGGVQAAALAVQEGVQVVVDYARVSIDYVTLQVNQAIVSTPLASALGVSRQTIENDQFALGVDETNLQLQLYSFFVTVEVFLGVPGYSLPSSGSTPVSSPSSSSSSSSSTTITGTYSGSGVPDDTGGDVDPNQNQTVTLTVNADGSGSLSMSPFDGTPLTVNFPAGTAQIAGGNINVNNYEDPNGNLVSVNASQNPNGSLGGYISLTGNNGYATFYDSITLNPQN